METQVAQHDHYASETRRHLERIDARQKETATKADLSLLKQEFDTMLYRNGTELIVWMAAIAAGVSFVTISVISFVVNNAAPKAPPQPPTPIIIYAQPAPVASSPASTKP
jgi:hypothetical protein